MPLRRTMSRRRTVPLCRSMSIRRSASLRGSFLAAAALLAFGAPPLHAGILFQSYGSASGLQDTAASVDFGRGVCIVDVDGDGNLDVFLPDGPGQPNRLFLGDGAFGFTEAPGAWGAADSTGNTKSAVFADYDNDGDQDVFLSRHSQDNRLLRNDGGAFTDVTTTAQVAGAGEHTYAAAWADVDNDGRLDLFVANRGSGQPDEANLLYLNQGGGVFTEVGALWQVGDKVMTLQPGFTDYDNDGDQDLYLADDKMQGNRLYRNDGTVFTEVSAASNADLVMDAMSVATGDVNHDGLSDIYITNTFSGNRCLVSHPDSTFVERADSMGTTVNDVGWGACFLDADLDGDEDLFEVNMGTMPNRMFANPGVYPWTNVSFGAGVNHVAESFGCAYGDLDGDGDLDLLVSNTDTLQVYRNITSSPGHWLQVTLQGTTSNRDGVGARVEIEFGGVTRFREIRAGSSYLSQMMHRAYFGLGSSTQADVVRVHWPSGVVDTRSAVAVDQVLHVVEGSTVSVPGDQPVPIAQARAFPNPFRGSTRLTATLTQGGVVAGRVTDVRGRLVLEETLGEVGPGSIDWQWSGQSASGNRVAAGVYWMEFRWLQHRVDAQVSDSVRARVVLLP